QDFIAAVASNEPVPGGGAAAAHVAALSAALGEMVANLTVGRERFAEVEPEVSEVLTLLTGLRQQLLTKVTEDAERYQRVLAARRLPRGEGGSERAGRIEEALKGAATVPLEVASLSLQLL